MSVRCFLRLEGIVPPFAREYEHVGADMGLAGAKPSLDTLLFVSWDYLAYAVQPQ